MGNGTSEELIDSLQDKIDFRKELQVLRKIDTVIGRVNEVKHPSKPDHYFIKTRYMDDRTQQTQHKLRFLAKDKRNCVNLLSVNKVESSQGFCTAPLYELRISAFEKTLHDIEADNLRFPEHRLWGIVLDLLRVDSQVSEL